VPGAEELIPKLKEITEYARQKGYQIMGSVDAHNEDDHELLRNDGPFPDHCMKQTFGQKKIREVRPESPFFITTMKENNLDFLDKYMKGEFFFEKQHYDVFTNENTEPVLKRFGVERAIVYGVATDYCVKAAAVGMANIGIEVYVLTDAISAITPETEKAALEEMKKAGVKFAESKELEEILGGG
jgi:nicotinamidase/pyrazinamidase